MPRFEIGEVPSDMIEKIDNQLFTDRGLWYSIDSRKPQRRGDEFPDAPRVVRTKQPIGVGERRRQRDDYCLAADSREQAHLDVLRNPQIEMQLRCVCEINRLCFPNDRKLTAAEYFAHDRASSHTFAGLRISRIQ